MGGEGGVQKVFAVDGYPREIEISCKVSRTSKGVGGPSPELGKRGKGGGGGTGCGGKNLGLKGLRTLKKFEKM